MSKKGNAMYVSPNFKTKKELKEAVNTGKEVTIFDPGPFNTKADNGIFAVEGPHYPEPHRWYAKVYVQRGIVVSVS